MKIAPEDQRTQDFQESVLEAVTADASSHSLRTPQPIVDSERQAARAFLQRGETRLSTYQRVAGVFLNGAGLLVLIPVLARDTISGVLTPTLSADLPVIERLVIVPWLSSIALALYALYLLLKDLVLFYFAPHFVVEDETRNISRFSLGAIAFSPDESTLLKGRTIFLQQRAGSAHYSFLAGRNAKGQKALVDFADNATPDPLRSESTREIAEHDGVRGDLKHREATRFAATFAVAGAFDRPLEDEVARMETSLVRHCIHLRRLVLRYVKALIVVLLSTLAALVTAAILAQPTLSESARSAAVYAVYTAWAALAFVGIRRPIAWIESLLDPDAPKSSKKPIVRFDFSISGGHHQDVEISEFETIARWWLVVSGLVSGLLAILALTF